MDICDNETMLNVKQELHGLPYTTTAGCEAITSEKALQTLERYKTNHDALHMHRSLSTCPSICVVPQLVRQGRMPGTNGRVQECVQIPVLCGCSEHLGAH